MNNASKPSAGKAAQGGKASGAGRASKPADRPALKKPEGVRAGSPMDLSLLQQLIELMGHNDLNTVELRDGEQRIMLQRGMALTGQPAGPSPAHAAPSQPAATPPPSASQPAPAAEARPAEDTSLVAITSPMVGTYYAAPSPDAKPFVQVGTKVGPDSDVCIIEAMKVFNNIKAEVSGTIERILVESGQSVEFGQKLFLVKPA
ncbi:MAG: acetyl-CoA carboxylase biotin carboxyl carrier protein [Phycisphaerae bacterium]